MKVRETPNRFFPGRAFTVEDLNRNLSHASNMIRNDQDAKFCYSSIRIPMATFCDLQAVGPAESESKDPKLDDSGSQKPTTPGNHEAMRTFAFVPPFDIKIASVDMYVKGATDSVPDGAEENEQQITDLKPMVAKVQWVSEDGGEGFPARPPSVLPEGFTPTGDPALSRIHDQMSLEIKDQEGYYTRTDNTEMTLRAGKCYRVMISSPDIPEVSKDFWPVPILPAGSDKYVYDQAWFWRYKMAWIQLNFKYDKWQFDKVNRPDVNFFTSKDSVDVGPLQAEVDNLESAREETVEKRRYPKPELYYFGMGNFNGLWNRPVSNPHAFDGTNSQMTWQAKNIDSLLVTNTDSFERKIIPDLSNGYSNNSGDPVLDVRNAHNFEFQAAWRAPMGVPSTKDMEGKQIVAYSTGLAHNITTDMWGSETTGPPLLIEDVKRHYGFDFHARIGHGLFTNPTNNPAAGFGTNNYQVANGSAFDTGNNEVTPALQGDNQMFLGGFPYSTYDPVGDTLPSPEELGWNCSKWGSTSIPQTQPAPAPNAIRRDEHYGVASGFPGDYLAEIHSGPQYGPDPDNPNKPGGALLNLDTSAANFEKPIPEGNQNLSEGINDQDDLFIVFNSWCSGTNAVTDMWEERQRRNFQKIYVLLWVM